ncbi:hypothetical protein D9756_007014 [Leucocoprinus leucothites]|uniref:FAD-binding domain-containing protein n=1 Tax=Leucocoprinus leucothites TaxID=201217 RepID=A0A8H5D5J1_9AGAR|nr:hypothetical protein D9756_007014 [Leucoagaricus leucothites]
MSQPDESQDRIRVAIVLLFVIEHHLTYSGAGIVGLILAVTLNTFDTDHKISIDIYESSSELSEIGAGINIWPRTWQIFQEIGPGLGEALKPFFDHLPDLELRAIFEVRKADQKDGFKVRDVATRGGALRIHRADLQRCLLNHLPFPSNRTVPQNSLCTLHLSHRLIDYTESSPGSVTLHFSNQPSKTCDILVGADGIKSTIRKIFLSRLPDSEKYAKCMDPVWSGAIAALGHSGLMYFGKNKHTVVYPISGGRFINVVAAVHDLSKDGASWDGNRPWNEAVPQRELMDHFEGWDEEYQTLIKCIEQPTKWVLQRMNPLDVFAKGSVFLMGDAVHAMVPYQGAGAAVGIDDAYILAFLLTHSSTPRSISPQCLSNITAAYNCTCVPHAHYLSNLSISQGRLNTLQLPEFDSYSENDENIPREALVEVFRRAERNWSWTVSDIGEERRRAEEMLPGPVSGMNGERIVTRL